MVAETLAAVAVLAASVAASVAGTVAATPAASAAGLVAFGCLSLWPLVRSRPGILAMQLGAGLGFAAHYALLGLGTTAVVAGLGAAQSAAALLSVRFPVLAKAGWALIPAMVLAGLVHWSGWTTVFCVTAMSLIAWGRMQEDVLRLRLFILAGGCFWVVHDAAVGSWIALAADLVSGALGIHAIARIRPRIAALVPPPRRMVGA